MENPLDLLKYKAVLKPADTTVIEQFKGMLPDFLINDWQQRGFSSYMNGLLITTDPNDYYDVIADWAEEPEKCHVIMRTAFGTLFCFKDGNYYSKSVIHDIDGNLESELDNIIQFAFLKKVACKRVKPITGQVQ